ncbi:hypothetical protein OH76DRAFT_114052 [Lentinus brumalis]|uniref:Uncharacterized protein n=1 Tax=Lentinus brumalis TaxID=2498619 RepID=A0A371CPV9_9APHY|nr:hypothetical protein OH76DRAFT_114052 [Polyporus brumalis]
MSAIAPRLCRIRVVGRSQTKIVQSIHCTPPHIQDATLSERVRAQKREIISVATSRHILQNSRVHVTDVRRTARTESVRTTLRRDRAGKTPATASQRRTRHQKPGASLFPELRRGHTNTPLFSSSARGSWGRRSRSRPALYRFDGGRAPWAVAGVWLCRPRGYGVCEGEGRARRGLLLLGRRRRRRMRVVAGLWVRLCAGRGVRDHLVSPRTRCVDSQVSPIVRAVHMGAAIAAEAGKRGLEEFAREGGGLGPDGRAGEECQEASGATCNYFPGAVRGRTVSAHCSMRTRARDSEWLSIGETPGRSISQERCRTNAALGGEGFVNSSITPGLVWMARCV